MDGGLVRAAGTAAAPGSGVELPEPTLRFLALRGLPAFAREGVIPVALFYAGWKLGGLGAGVALATVAALAVLAWEWRAGRRGTLAKVSLGLVVIQATTALVAHSETVYLAQPVLVSAAWGLAFLGSAAIGRPLAGAFAQPWYPFPEAFRATPAYRRVFAVESVVWGVYLLARSALRLGALLHGGVEDFFLVMLVTGTPAFALLTAWSVWYARRRLNQPAEVTEPAASP
jgi:hypothetical protein